MGISLKCGGATALLFAGAGLVLTAVPSTAFGQSIPIYDESPADALARNVRILAKHPKDFDALLGAGKAALRTGDPQAAAGFFGRARDVNPDSFLPLTGIGAALVATGDADGALVYFQKAASMGATATSIGCDRGLAYDLLGRQTAAQTDYRAALRGTDRDEARRRLALSLAISGNKSAALTTLQPLLLRHDLAASRVRAFVLALTGDLTGAKAALDAMMPGASQRMGPFFRRLPTLAAAQKAAAVNLGVFPEAGTQTQMAASTSDSSADRLDSIDELLAQKPAAAPAPAAPPTPTIARTIQRQPVARQPVQLASVPTKQLRAASPNTDLIQTQRVAADPGGTRIWLQLASAQNASEFTDEFRRIRARRPSLFTGISGYVARDQARSRLLIGPFHSQEDARLFADALASARIDSTSWTSQPGEVVRKLTTR